MSGHFLKTPEETKAWLDEMGVANYTIRDDLTVDVAGKVDISWRGLTYIPVQFGVVDGMFSCDHNQLGNLAGCPCKCKDFSCNGNQLTDLVGAPAECGHFRCGFGTLTSLVGAPAKCRNFTCTRNRLTCLSGGPMECGELECSDNQLTDLVGSPNKCIAIACGNNQLTTLDGAPTTCDRIRCDNGNPDLYDVSAATDGCALVYDQDVVAKNRAAKHLAELDTMDSGVTYVLQPKTVRIL